MTNLTIAINDRLGYHYPRRKAHGFLTRGRTTNMDRQDIQDCGAKKHGIKNN
jgi:hypothetical protein